MTVWICQCLCPERHAILATVGEATTEAEADSGVRTPLRRAIMELLNAGKFNPWCAICGAQPHTWRYELGRTKFASIDEAMPALRETEAANMATNRALGVKMKPN